MWLRGSGFLNFENGTTPLELRSLRCRWGGDAESPVTAPTSVEDDVVICPAAVVGNPATVPIGVALNGADVRKVGADAYVSKFLAKDLADTIRGVLARHP